MDQNRTATPIEPVFDDVEDVAHTGTNEDIRRLRPLTVLGQVLVFRVAQTLVLRRMKWTAIGDTERAMIKQVILQNLDAILEGTKP